MSRVGGTVLITYYLFSFFSLLFSTFELLSFRDIVEVCLFWLFGKELFRLGFILSVKFYAQRLVNRLSEVVNFQEKIKVIVLDVPVLNAFAFKKGGALGLGLWGRTERFIAITTELAKFSTKDELNFVIAHEFAHHYKNHFLVGFLGQFAFQLSLMTFLLKPFSLVGLFSTATLAVSSILLRRQEREADLLGVQFLQKVGYSCQGGITFFRKLSALSRTDSSSLTKFLDFFFSDHPAVEDRIRELEELCKKR